MTTRAGRVSALSPLQMHALDLACSRIHDAFDRAPMLVGSVLTDSDYRDVDVRLILPNNAYAALTVDQWTLIGFGLSAWLSAFTGGLPIDFQVQQQSTATRRHKGKKRNPLGVRHLGSFTGDASPATRRPGRVGRGAAASRGTQEGHGAV